MRWLSCCDAYDVSVAVACGDVHKNEPTNFRSHCARREDGLVANVSEQVDRYLRAGSVADKYAFECVDVLGNRGINAR